MVLVSVGAGLPSEAFAAPYPTKSRVIPGAGLVPVAGVVVVASSTLPEVALMAMLPLASGVGSGVVPPAPCASWTR